MILARRRQRGWIVATVMLGTMSTIIAATIVNVAFPALIAEFHVGHDSLQWVATGFLAATTTTMLATAWMVETLRRAHDIHRRAGAVPRLVGCSARRVESPSR